MGTENVLGNLNATVLSENGVAISEKYASKDDVEIETEVKVFTDNWSEKTWNGLTSFNGNEVWTDGRNVYYSFSSNQYVLDKATSTWSPKTWIGHTTPFGEGIWTDGENIYYSLTSIQYVLDKFTSTWSSKTWTGLTSFDGQYVWTDGRNVYYSYGNSKQYVLDKATSTWSQKAWTGLTDFSGNYIWTDGESIYYSNGQDQYVLDKDTSTWSPKTWIGLTELYGTSIWKNGENVYYSYGSSKQYVLDKSTSTWSQKAWTGLTGFSAGSVWTDGDDVYYSEGSSQYVLDTEQTTIPVPVNEYVNGLVDKSTLTEVGDMYYASSKSNPTRLSIGDENQVLSVSNGVPIWKDLPVDFAVKDVTPGTTVLTDDELAAFVARKLALRVKNEAYSTICFYNNFYSTENKYASSAYWYKLSSTVIGGPMLLHVSVSYLKIDRDTKLVTSSVMSSGSIDVSNSITNESKLITSSAVYKALANKSVVLGAISTASLDDSDSLNDTIDVSSLSNYSRLTITGHSQWKTDTDITMSLNAADLIALSGGSSNIQRKATLYAWDHEYVVYFYVSNGRLNWNAGSDGAFCVTDIIALPKV